MRLMDRCFDDRAAMMHLLAPIPGLEKRHLVRETGWYALGLLMRNREGDRERAIRGLNAILECQINQPGISAHGTFLRYPDEPRPGPGARRSKDYDPNWREFIGTTFQLILIHYADRLPQDLTRRMEAAIRLAVEGEIQEGRLRPAYSNIALLYGALIDFAGARFKNAGWSRRAAEWTALVHREFTRYGAFTEFNSPTYYGTDLSGLVLWRDYGTTAAMREAGAGMEAALWRSIASMYHAGLSNMAGPYDRAYGMDMRHYATLVGLYLLTTMDAGAAPFPPIEYGVDHGTDISCTPQWVLVPTRIPKDVRKHFHAFQGERLVKQQITATRTATAWIGKDYLLGGEFTGKTKASPPGSQFHPATIHWRGGWVRLLDVGPVDATAARDTLTISCTGSATFRIAAPGLKAGDLQREQWLLPGLTVRVETDAGGVSVEPAAGHVDVIYRNATRFTLTVRSTR